jgi:hypothetical protein
MSTTDEFCSTMRASNKRRKELLLVLRFENIVAAADCNMSIFFL